MTPYFKLTLIFVTLLIVLSMMGCASEVHITVPQSKAEECQAAGGCGLLTRAKVMEMLRQAHDEGAAEALEDLDSHGCKRGAT